MGTNKRISLAVLFMMLSLSCKTIPMESSRAKHDAGRFLNSPDSNLWGDFSEVDYQNHQVKSGYSKMLPIDHELSKRLQFWADIIREKMIEIMPELASVPAPKVRILKSDSVNAFAQTIQLTVVADIALTTPSESSKLDGDPIYFGKECMAPCPVFKGDINAKRSLVESAQKRVNPNCKVQASQEALEFEENCLASSVGGYKGPGRFKAYNTIQMLNYVSILSESIKVMSENDIVVTLAHELGHYYLAHPVYQQFPDVSTPYNYLYVKGERPNSGKPKALSVDDSNYALVKEFDETIDVSVPVLEGQKYPTAIDLAIAGSISDGLNRGGIVDRCVTGTDLKLCLNLGYEVTKPGNLLSQWAFNTKDMYRREALDSARDSVIKFEEALSKNASIFRSSVLSNLQESLAKYIGTAAPQVVLGEKDETVATFLPKYIEKAKIALEENPKKLARLTQSIADKGLGFYTVEQEADDIATEILYELGFEPDQIIQNWLNFLDRSSEPQNRKDSCKANYASGFKSPVWIGLSTEPHHSNCYRAYNAFEEIRNHRDFFEKNKKATKASAPGDNWEELVARLKGKSFIALPAR